MSKKEESLRRSVLSREGQDRDRASKRRGAQLIAMASIFAGMPGIGHAERVNLSAKRGRFSSGDVHPDKCSCKQCSDWRRAERYR